MINLSAYLTPLKIKGTDAKKFLQGQLTCDVDSLSSGNGCMGAHCTPQGRVISLFYLFFVEDTYYLYLPPNITAIALKALKKYAVFYKTELMIVDKPEYLLVGTFTDPLFIKDKIATLKLPSKTARYLLLLNTAEVFAETIILSAWEEQNFQDAIPTVYAETSGKFLPHDINLPALGVINFNKGCYTGQEIIARMEYRGKLKTHLYRAILHTNAKATNGESIYCLEENKMIECATVVTVMPFEAGIYHILLITEEKYAKNKYLFLSQDPHNYFII